MANAEYRTPQDVATQLDVSPSTLRRWSDEFAEFLSSEAGSLDGKSHRRYTEQDMTRLLVVKDYMHDGMTYEQVRLQLREQMRGPSSGALISNDDAAASVMDYFSETVENMRQGQASILNSQSANRELMGVVIQDNFNLKEENNRLRNRMLDLERQIGEIRREEDSRRESFRQEVEMKLMEIREAASRSPVTVLQSRAGCLGSLFGSGKMETIPNQERPPATSSRSYPPRPPGPPE